ncbi:DMT family transporter [Rhizobium halophytocola]|uniref:Drug/metabolite transporter (DMT)-like permease n=1 Tax=Rhizobium halophytocola TaxID=735519 RepID=A0ABS4DZ36_9HYPH|nr:DMT family transporter [Rhizobium halophytocola]MBP1850951.1 drug/metabolite transporter (DMT)-like permease [Rhizobium halophytocola]
MALSNNTRGALLMALAMAGFTCNDALTKTLAADLPAGQMMLVRGAIMTCLLVVIAGQMGALRQLRTLLQPMVFLRVGCESLATIAFLSALGQLPLANISAILQSLPLATTLGAALIFREPVGWYRWGAIIVGFCGILLIVRPGAEGFTTASLLMLVSVCGAAGRDLATKRVRAGTPSIGVTLATASGAVLVGSFMLVPTGGWQPMSGNALAVLAIAALLLVVAHQSIVLAMRTADEISFIAPLRYTSLLWAVSIGVLAFGEQVDPLMALGALVVIASGLYTFYREKKRKLPRPVAQEPTPTSSAL